MGDVEGESGAVRDAVEHGAALLGGTISDAEPAPGTFVHHLRALLAAVAAGALDRHEVTGSLRRFRQRQSLEQRSQTPLTRLTPLS